MSIWITSRCRSYISELPCIGSQALKNLMKDTEVQTWQFTSTRSVALYATRKEDIIKFQLPDGNLINVSISKSQVTYGWRYWYICPHCHKRYKDLYFSKKDIACRKCWQLHYPSQSESPNDRMMRKIRRMRRQLFGKDHPEVDNLTILAHQFPKPIGMSQHKFDEAINKLIQVEGDYWGRMRIFIEDGYGCDFLL